MGVQIFQNIWTGGPNISKYLDWGVHFWGVQIFHDRPYNESPELQFAWLWWSLTASEALSYGLNLKNFPRGACPQTLLERCVLYVHKEKISCAACAAWPHQPHSVCPPLLQPWIRPWGCTRLQHRMLYKNRWDTCSH